MQQINLSPKQQEIVGLNEGAFLILASAGSGKTRVLTERIKRLSESPNGKILAITFTNKAAAEIRERLGTSDRIKKNVFVGTFHSFCQSILELRFKLLGYSKMPHIFEDDADRIELIKQAIKSVPYFDSIYNDLEPKKKNQYTYNALQFISTVKREVLTAEELAEGSENNEYEYLYETYQDILKSNNAIDFDDIIRLVYELFTNNESVANLYRKSYSYICIDECQDLNKLQYYLLKSLCGNTFKSIMMVGDPNQAIYGFNGSAASFMEEDFVSDFAANKITLDENYRCSKSVIEASNVLMNLEVEVVNFVIPGVFEIYEASSENDEAQFVVGTIKKLLKATTHKDIEGDITFDKISILGRNKYVFTQVEEELRAESIPFYYKSGNASIKFSSASMKAFDLFFRVKINPLDKLHQKRLEDMLKVGDINSSEELKSSKLPIASDIKCLLDNASIDNFHIKINELKSIFNNSDLEDDEKKLTLDELNDLENHLVQYKKQNLKPSLDGFKSALALGLTNNSTNKETGICLSTVHTMKGQESEIVFLIGMDDGTFPDFRAVNKGGEELQQEKNNTYVAFTRAKRFLYVSYPKKRLMPWGDHKAKTISRFLKPLV
ncbi:ATP-dependent helicase [Leeuwenhoekiella palythoae]|uniref:DNA 3'-5' helicase n=1 Tax=Leeuwenhoekiella palythoae TaxID=573501 RepID=A0A1M5WN58_9FLAO|nr:ATP-dependent helicase [Leeuwenhoekiella palythoae]RXG31427.1 DNA helicase-2/ATP-dependent DNA helicase PcrA [Leeuwenhoekiella palythoae]SHH88544.1 DNA helicase-2 / ATP-dependent DNA helicase PcrA [Leeuwenhoekiella palythoae]